MTNPSLNQSGATFKRTLFWSIKFFVSAALVVYLVSKIGAGNAFEKAFAIPVTHLVGAFFLLLLQAVLGGIRWRFVVIALGARLTARKAVLITFISLFFNQFLPASVGADIVRVWQSNKAGLALPTGITSVFLERFGNLLCVVGMTIGAIPIWTKHFYGDSARSAFIGTGIAAVLLLIVVMNLDRLPSIWRRWGVFRWLATLALDSRSLFLHPFYASMLFTTAIAGQLALVGAAYVLAQGLGLNLSPIDFLATIPAVALLSSLPISIAGWGVRELAMVSVLGVLAVPAESALALSFVLALAGIAVSLPGGLVWLTLRHEAKSNSPHG
jgi:uncharacterized membrane protein YbhN (UPF0104 family)